MKFYIIIPVHNRLKDTLSCLESLQGQTEENWDKEIIIIDDGSTDGTKEVLSTKYPDIKLLCGDGTLWFTESVNMGINYVLNRSKDDDFILIINNDTILASNYIENLILAINNNPNSIIGGILVDSNDKNTILEDGIYYNKFRFKFYTYKKWKTVEEINIQHFNNVEILPTRGIAIPVSVFKEIGLMDSKNFPQAASDYDFTLSARQYGYKLIVSYDCIIYSENNFGHIPTDKNISLKEFIKSYTNIKSSYNVKVFMKFGIKHFKQYKLFIPGYLFRILLGSMNRYFRSKIL